MLLPCQIYPEDCLFDYLTVVCVHVRQSVQLKLHYRAPAGQLFHWLQQDGCLYVD